MRQKRRAARLLQRHVGTKYRGVRRAYNAQYHAIAVHHRHGDLRRLTGRPPNLGPCAIRHLQRRAQRLLHLGRSKAAIGTALYREQVAIGTVYQDIRAEVCKNTRVAPDT